MIIGFIKEKDIMETRIALIPEHIKKIIKKEDIKIYIEKDYGEKIGYKDEEYIKKGAEVKATAQEIIKNSDCIVKVGKIYEDELELMEKGKIFIGMLNPYNEIELIKKIKEKGVNAFSLEFIPRTTYAQKMDVLSSQASIAGYAAVTLGAMHNKKIFPMMMTPAGTINPSKVFVIGVGVAGLQAIATAKRLGARVEAFDTRPAVEEQVKSLGAKFIKIDIGKTAEEKSGYAAELTEEQLRMQQLEMEKACISADVVITTAKLFGKKAPLLIKKEVVEKMRYGSVIVDLAAETGGNVEGVEVDKILNINGVKLIGCSEPAKMYPIHSSQMYSGNISALLEDIILIVNEKSEFNYENDIFKSGLIIKDGEITNKSIKEKAGEK